MQRPALLLVLLAAARAELDTPEGELVLSLEHSFDQVSRPGMSVNTQYRLAGIELGEPRQPGGGQQPGRRRQPGPGGAGAEGAGRA